MILISGATGFLGTHLLKKLCNVDGLPVRALYRSENKKTYTLDFLNLFCSELGKVNISKIVSLRLFGLGRVVFNVH